MFLGVGEDIYLVVFSNSRNQIKITPVSFTREFDSNGSKRKFEL